MNPGSVNTAHPLESNLQKSGVLAKINSLPGSKKKLLFEKARVALTLGLRAVVLDGLKPSDKNEFEKIVLERGDDGLFLFGQAHVENFEEKFAVVMDEVSKSLFVELTK